MRQALRRELVAAGLRSRAGGAARRALVFGPDHLLDRALVIGWWHDVGVRGPSPAYEQQRYPRAASHGWAM